MPVAPVHLLSRPSPRAGVVALRQTFARRAMVAVLLAFNCVDRTRRRVHKTADYGSIMKGRSMGSPDHTGDIASGERSNARD